MYHGTGPVGNQSGYKYPHTVVSEATSSSTEITSRKTYPSLSEPSLYQYQTRSKTVKELQEQSRVLQEQILLQQEQLALQYHPQELRAAHKNGSEPLIVIQS